MKNYTMRNAYSGTSGGSRPHLYLFSEILIDGQAVNEEIWEDHGNGWTWKNNLSGDAYFSILPLWEPTDKELDAIYRGEEITLNPLQP